MVLKNVRKQILKLHMIEPNDRILVGVSGGADSVALLLVLKEIQKELEFTLEAIHVEHGIRGAESQADQSFVEELCKSLQVDYHSYSVDVPEYARRNGLGLEEAARLMRYEIFEKEALLRKAKIALAHHMEDNAETILFQMARGSSLNGLCGMQPVREGTSGVIYIRPLLSIHRKDIENYLDEQQQAFCTDSTNADIEYSRNYIRKVILPDLTKINAQAVSHINESASYLSDVRDFMEKEVESAWEDIATVGESIVLDIEKIKVLHLVLQKEIIYKAIGIMAGGKKDISSVHVEQVLGLSQNQSGKEISLPNQLTAIRENATIRLFFSKEKSDRIENDIFVSEEELKNPKEINCGKGTFSIRIFNRHESEGEIPRKTYTKWFDYDKINSGFCIRTRRSGDYLIYDEKGHHKKLKQYFVDEKIPVTKRDEVFVLAKEDVILWVVGGRISEHVKVTETTKTIVEITYKEES